MPFQIGSVAVHDDGQHTGSAKRDTVSGVAGVDASGNVVALGDAIGLSRGLPPNIYIKERTSNEYAMKLYRSAANSYEGSIHESGVMKRIQTESMKNAASGIAGLDASILLSLAQQRTNFKIGTFTRDMTLAAGNQAVAGVGFVPRFVIFLNSRSGNPDMSIGFDDGTLQYSVADAHLSGADTYEVQACSINNRQGAAIYHRGVISSFDADGFTVTWSKLGAVAGTTTVFYAAIK